MVNCDGVVAKRLSRNAQSQSRVLAGHFSIAGRENELRHNTVELAPDVDGVPPDYPTHATDQGWAIGFMPGVETIGLPNCRQAKSQTRRLIGVEVRIVAEEEQTL